MVFSAVRKQPSEAFARSGRHSLDDGDVARSGDDAGQAEAVGSRFTPARPRRSGSATWSGARASAASRPRREARRYSASVRSWPLATTSISRSMSLPKSASFARRDDHLDQEQFPAGVHALAAVPQDRRRLVIGPVVDDVLHQVGVAAGRHALEEVAADGPTAPSGPPRGWRPRPRPRHAASRTRCRSPPDTPGGSCSTARRDRRRHRRPS